MILFPNLVHRLAYSWSMRQKHPKICQLKVCDLHGEKRLRETALPEDHLSLAIALIINSSGFPRKIFIFNFEVWRIGQVGDQEPISRCRKAEGDFVSMRILQQKLQSHSKFIFLGLHRNWMCECLWKRKQTESLMIAYMGVQDSSEPTFTNVVFEVFTQQCMRHQSESTKLKQPFPIQQ